MRKLTITISLFFLIFLPCIITAQTAKSTDTNQSTNSQPQVPGEDWVAMMRNPKVNVHDVQKAFYAWYEKKQTDDKEEVKGKHKSATIEKDEDESYELFKRWEWLNAPRADVNGNRADLNKVGAQYENYLLNSSIHTHSHHSLTSNSASWTYQGNTTVPTNSSTGFGGNGRVNRVRLMPGNNNTIFACAASGGLWKTTNGGASWSTNTDQLGDLTTSDIAINPLDTNIMYLATGDGDGLQSIYPDPATIGVLKSFDGGNTWTATSLATTLATAGIDFFSVNEILIDPQDTSVILAATTFGIYRSANSGATWTQTTSSTWFHSIEFEPGHPAIVYAASSTLFFGIGANFFKSVNNGISWTKITSGLPSSSVAEGFDIGVTAADSSVVYVLADNQTTYDYNGLYLSTNHGVSFTKQSGSPSLPNVLGRATGGNDYGVGQGWYDLTMSVSQTNADSVYVGGINIWASSNKGVTWTQNSDWTATGAPFVHADIHHIQFIPGTNSQGYVVGCDGGVFITSNSGVNWTNISNNLAIGQQYSIGPSSSINGLWITGWQDNGTNLSGSPWAQVYGGDGMVCFIDRNNNSLFYAETPEGGLARSADAGLNWTNIDTDITESGPWVTQWLQDPKTNTTLYSGFSNVWKSTDSGTGWTKISPFDSTGLITGLAVDSANPNFIYASQSKFIEVTANGGTTWTNITSTLPVDSAAISSIAVSAKQPSHVWVTFSGYATTAKVFQSINSGTTWTNISAGLPNLPINCIVSESGSPNSIYVGTDQGVYYHDTASNSWVFYNNGLPLVMIGDIKIHQPGQQLLVATYGRGTWESPLYNSSTCPIVTANVTSNIKCTGGNSGSVSATVFGGASPYTFSWTGGSTTSTETGLSAGTYTITLTDHSGCSSTSSATITNITLQIIDSLHANITCTGKNNGFADFEGIGGTSPYTFSWSPGGNTNHSVSGLTAGTYTVTLKDKNACSATTSITITQPASALGITIKSHIQIPCAGGTGSATANIATGGTPEPFISTVAGNGVQNVSGNGGQALLADVGVPTDIAFDATGNMYVTEFFTDGVVRKINTSGIISTIAGDLFQGYSGDGGPATSAELNSPRFGKVDATGNVYISDQGNDVIRKVNISGIISTFAGNHAMGAGYSGDGGPATLAEISSIENIGVDASGNLYIADEDNHRIRKVDHSTGIINTVVGNGTQSVSGDGGPATAAGLAFPSGVAIDALGNMYIVENLVDPVVRKVNTSGIISTFACNRAFGAGYSGDGGPATSAELNDPFGVAVDASGNVYISDNGNDVVRKVNPSGIISTFAGNHALGSGFSGDEGPATSAELNTFESVAVNASGNVFIADEFNERIREVTSTGSKFYSYVWTPGGSTNLTVTTNSAGTFTITVTDNNGCTATASSTIAQGSSGLAVTIASHTNVKCNGGSNGTAIANTATGGTPIPIINTVAGNGVPSISCEGCPATSADVGFPTDVAFDPTGNMYITEFFSNGVVRMVNTVGISIFAGDEIQGYSGDGGPAQSADLNSPRFAKVDATGNVYISDQGNDVIRKVNTSGIISTFAGNNAFGAGYSGDGGQATSAEISSITNIGTDASGNVYIADLNNHRIRKITTATGIITTVAGNGLQSVAGDGGPATAAGVAFPSGVAVDVSGNIYIVENLVNPVVRKVNTAGIISTFAGTNAVPGGYSGDGGPATSAELNNPFGVTVDASGNVYISDNGNNVVRKVNTSGIISTYAGNNHFGAGYSGDGGLATSAEIQTFESVGVDPSGNIYIADENNNRVREVTSTGSTFYNYSWTPSGGTNLVITGLSAGTYTITATDFIGCTDETSVTITQPTLLRDSISAKSGVACEGGSSGSATIGVKGGTSPYTFTWAPGGKTTANVSTLSAGNYTITIRDGNACENTVSVTITQPPTLLRDSVANLTEPLCNAQTGSAIIGVKGGIPPYTFSWSPIVNTTAFATSLSAGSYTVNVKDNNACSETVVFTVTQPNAITTSISSHTNVSCNGNSTASATANAATGGTSPFTYSWAPNGGTNLTASSLSAGIYTITATDKHGCTGSISVTITQPTLIRDSVSLITGATCNGGSTGSATIGVKGGTSPYTFLWAPGGKTTANVSTLSAGSYTVTVKDINACSNTLSLTITQPSLLRDTLSSLTAPLCFGQKGSVILGETGGTLPYTFTWSPNVSTTSFATSISAGSYTVTIKDKNACSNTLAVNITQPSTLAITIPTHTNVGCNGNSTAGATASTPTGGTSPFTYNWSPNGGTNLAASNLSSGTYTITATDNHGCTATASVVITQPAIIRDSVFASSGVLCSGGSTGSATVGVKGGTSPYTFLWAPGGKTTATASALSAGSYTVTVKDINSCSSTVLVTITQPTLLRDSLAIFSNALCNGKTGSATIGVKGGTSPYTFTWSPNVSTTSFANSISAGTYTVTIKDKNACSNTVLVNITQPLVLAITISSTHSNESCNGNSTASATANSATGGTSPYTYFWSPSGGTNLTASNLSAGTYSITATDNHGCAATASVIITQPAAALAITISTHVNVNCSTGTTGSATANAATGGTSPYTYSWAPSGGTNLSASNLSAGTYTITATDNHGCIATTSVVLTQVAVVRDSVSAISGVACNGGSTGSATIGVKGGTSPYTFSWIPGGKTMATVSTLSAGSYTVIVKDKNGCTNTALISITQPLLLKDSAASLALPLCNGLQGNATIGVIGGSSPYTFSWNPNVSTSNSATSLSIGSYTVTVKDKNACSSSVIFNITQPSILSITISTHTNVDCNGNFTGSATASAATGGTSPYAYNWTSNAGTNLTASNLSAGTYTIIATDNNGCMATASVNITQPAAPLAITISSQSNVGCNGNSTGSATANAATGGTSPYAYNWSPNGGTHLTASNLSAGVYNIIVTDAHGCTTEDTVIISQPAVLSNSLSFTPASCDLLNGSASDSITGGTPPYTYLWNPSGETTATADSLSAGTYTVTATDSNGCSLTSSVTITQPVHVKDSIVSSINVTCGGGNNGSATVGVKFGVTPYTYSWKPSGGTGRVASNLSAGTYTIIVTGHNGCPDSAFVSITAPPLLSVGTVVTNVTCFNEKDGSAVAVGTGGITPYTYRWSNGKTTQTISSLSAGSYTITIRDKNNCSATANATITEPSPISVIRDSVADNGTCNGIAAVTVSGGTPAYTYLWSPGGQRKDTIKKQCAGDYCCTITDNNNCTIVACITIISTVGIENINHSSTIIIYPNPTNGALTIEGTEQGQLIEIFDVIGQKIISVIADNSDALNLNISDKANGIYLVRIQNKDGSIVIQKKVVKMQ